MKCTQTAENVIFMLPHKSRKVFEAWQQINCEEHQKKRNMNTMLHLIQHLDIAHSAIDMFENHSEKTFSIAGVRKTT